jgi:hypothetical protein
MEVTVHLDGNPAVREEGFFEGQVITLENQIKALQYENAELIVKNDEISQRVIKLARGILPVDMTVLKNGDKWVCRRSSTVEQLLCKQ